MCLEVILFHLNVSLNMFKDIEALRMGYFNFHFFSGVRQRIDYDLVLMLISWWLTNLVELNDHISHMPQMLSHRVSATDQSYIYQIWTAKFFTTLYLCLVTQTHKRCHHPQQCIACLSILGFPLVMERYLLIGHSKIESLDFIDVVEKIVLKQDHLYTVSPDFIVIIIKSRSVVQLIANILSGGHISLTKKIILLVSCRHNEQCSNSCEWQVLDQSGQTWDTLKNERTTQLWWEAHFVSKYTPNQYYQSKTQSTLTFLRGMEFNKSYSFKLFNSYMKQLS